MRGRERTADATDRSRTHRRRSRVLAAVWILLAFGYVGRAAQLQVVEAETWKQAARAQSSDTEEIPARRGALLDRDGRALARESQAFRVYLAPYEVRDMERAVSAVGRVLGLSEREQQRLRTSDKGWVVLPRRVAPAELHRLETAVPRGLHAERMVDRVFPQGPLARGLLGSVAGSGEGSSGLELALDSLLRGTPGAKVTRLDAQGAHYRIPDGEVTAPLPGHDVVLTLDTELQRIAEDALGRAVQKTGASGGDVLMLDPRTGEILAVASERARHGAGVPAFTSPYEPGSTLKPLLLATLLQEGKADLSELVDTEQGRMVVGGRTIRDVHPLDTLTVAEVIQHSSNVGAVKLAQRLTPGLQYRYLRDFGFGVPAGIEYTSESAGLLRKPESWSALSQASLAMGYEVSVTPLQLAAAYAALANGGVLLRPHLIREVRSATDGEIVYEREPEPIRRVVSSEVAREVTRVLGSVVEGGTATRAALATLPLAGKTGTTRTAAAGGYTDERYEASFVGYTPADDPRLVILTRLDDPQGDFYGGLTAAPISRATLQAALAARGVELPGGSGLVATAERLRWDRLASDDAGGSPFVFAASTPSSSRSGAASTDDAAGRVVLPDLAGLPLRTAAARLHALGLRVELVGKGEIRGQDPPPGTSVRPGATVRLR